LAKRLRSLDEDEDIQNIVKSAKIAKKDASKRKEDELMQKS
jgi:hypothetical protein